MKRLTTNELIQKAIKIHGYKYDYSKVDYVNSTSKVKIECPEHGEFEQRASSHLMGVGCPECGKIKSTGNRTSSNKSFVERAREVHGDKYDYSKVRYENSSVKVTVICPVHGAWDITPNNHLRGQGCKKCSLTLIAEGTLKKRAEDFINSATEMYGNMYDYSEVNYVKNCKKVTIICTQHGKFKQTPNSHLNGSGCPKCGEISRGESKSKTTIKNRNWNFEQPEEYKLIPLSNGKFAKVDNEDFDRLKGHVWYCGTGGYVRNNNLGSIHRCILKAPMGLDVDHVNHDTLDNRKGNLRLATRHQNSTNTRPKGGSSVYKGVSWSQTHGQWKGQIYIEGKNLYLGLFDDEIECAKAYDRKALELFGEFAYLNFPELKDGYLV